jgi:hypothetical protein
MIAPCPTFGAVAGLGSASMAVPHDLDLGVVHVSEPLDVTAYRIAGDAISACPDNPAIVAFSALVQSQRQGDRREVMRLLRVLRGYGDSVVVIGTGSGREPR